MFDTRMYQGYPSFIANPPKFGSKRSVYSKSGAACRNVKQKIDKTYAAALEAQFGKRCSPKGRRFINRCVTGLTRCNSKELIGSTYVQDYGRYLKAFSLIYVLPEDEWHSENIDRLLNDGAELFQRTSEEDHGNGALEETGGSIKRNFKLEGHSFTLELKPPYKEPQEKHIIKNLKFVLKEFFDSAHYCLFLYKTVNLLIWQRDTQFFVMNLKEQHPVDIDCYQTGGTMLVRLPSLNNVNNIIRNLSGSKAGDEFILRELAVIRLVTPDGRCFLRSSTQPSPEYSVINKNYAYLKSNLHLSLNPEELLRNGSGLVVGVMGILAANIEHPASWIGSTLDSIICFGVELYRNRWCTDWQGRLPTDLDTFPTEVRLGQFVVEIKLLPKIFSGQWRGGANAYKGNDFALKISNIIKDYGNALFEINTQLYALWCKDEHYYLLDPYRHQVMKSTQTNEDGEIICAKWATVRMFRDLTNMLHMFHQLLKESNGFSTFKIHAVAIKHISDVSQEDADCKTTNESIRFPQLLKNYEQLLSGDSDYEPDVASSTEDTIGAESFTVFESSKGEDNDFKRIDVEVEVLRPSTAKCDIRNHKSETDARPMSPIRKPKRKVIKPKDYINDNKTKEKLNYLRKKVCIIDAPNPDKNEAGVARKTVKTNPKRIAQKDLAALTNQNTKANAIFKISQLDAQICAKYRNMEMDQFDFGSCKQCQRCPAGQNQSTQKLNIVSETSFHTARPMDKDVGSTELKYPVYNKYPANLAVAGSESGTMESINRLLDVAFKVSNRVLTITPWGNYVVFRNRKAENAKSFYIFDGCTCNIDRFRHLDLRQGTAGLMAFQNQSEVVCFMIDSRESKALTMVRSRLEQPCRGT